MILSLIVPVYNGEAFLQTCLDSILCQAGDTFEVLVVDDGSTDASLAIARRRQRTDTRLRVLAGTTNRLPGHVRNMGIKSARGTYLWFVDADDRVAPNAVSQLLEVIAASPETEIFSFGYREHVSGTGKAPKFTEFLPRAPKKPEVPFTLFLKLQQGYTSMPFSYLFRREFLQCKAMVFPEDTYFEDLYFMALAFYHVRNIRFLEAVYYDYYRTNENSITMVQSKKKLIDLLASYEGIRQFLCEEGMLEEYQGLLAFRFLTYGLPRCFRMYFLLPAQERNAPDLRARVHTLRSSNIMRLKNLRSALTVARSLEGQDVRRKREYLANLRLLFWMKYGMNLIGMRYLFLVKIDTLKKRKPFNYFLKRLFTAIL